VVLGSLPAPQPSLATTPALPQLLGTGRAALTALLGSSLQHAVSGGSRRSWPMPASGSPGCLRRNEKGARPGTQGHAACQGAPEHRRLGGTGRHLEKFAVPADVKSGPMLRQL